MNPTTLITLCSRATPETLRRNPTTRSYVQPFFQVAKTNGLAHARAWLLGRILLDLHPDPDPILSVSEPGSQPAPPHPQSTDSPRVRLQQHIEAAASHLDTTRTPL